jgi:Tfp pilus assembly protein PilP
MDPKGTIDAARTAAGAATKATTAREAAVADPKAGAPMPAAAAVAAAAAPALTPSAPKYEAQGRRDPFESLEIRVGSERSSVATAKLTGLIHSETSALALVETSDGIGYILKPGDTLADGRLLEIGTNTVVFSVAPKPGATTNRVVLKLTSD